MLDSEYMKAALSLARLAIGYTSPNPAVGAVIAKENNVIGMGYTQPAGSDHAEIIALRQAGDHADGATMYVTLEPCCHYGRTPPCTQAIIDAGISEIYISLLDPNPLVSGQGVIQLNNAGIKTHVGAFRDEAYTINEAYFKFIVTGIPFVTAKFAVSLDGKIATKSGDSKWISNNESRKYVHKLRDTVDAIVVGVNTVLVDNPSLTARNCCCGRGGICKDQPLRLVVDSKGKTPVEALIFQQPGETTLVIGDSIDSKKKEQFIQLGIKLLEVPDNTGLVDVEKLLQVLGKQEITSILVEGGSQLLGSFFDHRLVDKVLVFVSPIIIGGSKATTAVAGDGVEKVTDAFHLNCIDIEKLGDNMLVSGYVPK